MKTPLFPVLLVALGATSLSGAPAPEAAPPAAAAQTPASIPALDRRVDRIAVAFGLSDIQKGELKMLLLQRRQRMQAAAAGARRAFRRQFAAILTPEQRERLPAILQAKRQAAGQTIPPAGEP